MKIVIKSIIDACRLRHGVDTVCDIGIAKVLNVFLIAYKPTDVFESMGVREQSLCYAAIPVAAKLQRLLACLATSRTFDSVPRNLTNGFSPMLSEYVRCFAEWKIPDTQMYVDRLKDSLTALYDAIDHLPSHEPENSLVRVQLRAQVERVREKLNHIAGTDTLVEFDNRRFSAMNTTTRVSPEQLGHEVLLDPTFTLNEYGEITDNRVRAGIRKSFLKVSSVLLFFFCIRVPVIILIIRADVLGFIGLRLSTRAT